MAPLNAVTPETTRTVLPNGLTVLVRADHALPIATAFILYKVGARDEALGKSGMVHFIEHMVFKGTSKYQKGEIDRALQRLGGEMDAYTTEDFTSFSINVPAKHLGTALAIEADLMRNCTYDPGEIEAERKVVLEERRADRDDPLTVFEEALLQKVFTVHPYRSLILGEMEEIKGFKREQIIKFYNTYYRPNNAILVITGDIRPEPALRSVREYFGDFPRGPDRPLIRFSEPPQRQERRLELRRRVAYPVVVMAFRAPASDTRNGYALRLISNILAGGESSRLYKDLVKDRPLFNNVSALYYESLDPYFLPISAELKDGVTRQQAEAALWQEIERLRQEPPSAYELQKAKNQLAAEHVFGQENIADQAELLARTEFFYGYQQLERYLDEIRSVTREDIQRVARQYLVKETRTVGWLLPEPR